MGNKKQFAALAPPYDKVTYADKIAGATKGKKKMGGYTDKYPVTMKKGGTTGAGKTTTGVTSNYKGYKGPKKKNPVAKVKKSGKL
jgi:hypothetical protein